MKTLDATLAAIHADPANARGFILADARDADMAFGLAAPGTDPVTGRPRSLADYRDQMREVVRQGLVDIMLMSASTNDVLTGEGLFSGSTVTPAVRANDSTDIHVLAGATYSKQPPRPLRTPRIDEIMRGGTNLALYSITPVGDAERDALALEAYRDFRADAESAGLRHFLEVFPPNVPVPFQDVGRFLNDFIARTLAGVPGPGRPVFLKMPYSGPRAMEELVRYDPHLVPGVLGGSAGTTHDAFLLLQEARRHGARAALFGRKIKQSEHQLTFVRYLRAIADDEIDAANACRAYHADLGRLGVRPCRSLQDDLQLTDPALAQATC
ncbi:MAG: hypothetical protein EHM13_00920 [Acidobacteria bacterium]|nr:MAG: hypothetical protein EHM13_00920 [Acidobacteriota bacterium]